MPSHPIDDRFTLCGNCGTILHDDAFEYLKHEEDGDHLVPVEPGDMDPIVHCPVCRFEHSDDDSGPGMWGGSFVTMNTERAQCLRDTGIHDYDYTGDWRDVLIEASVGEAE